MIFFPHKSMTHPTLQLFVGWLEVQEKDRGCMATALSIHEYVADRRVFSQTRLAVTGVKFKRKGALGSFVFNWNPRFSTMEELRTSDIGSISITCTTTTPDRYNINIFYFFNTGKVKISGKTIAPALAHPLGEKQHPELTSDEQIDFGLKEYFNCLMEQTVALLGVTPVCENFPLCFLNGGFDIDYIPAPEVQRMAIRSRDYPEWFVKATGQEPEINGRMFAVKLFLEEKLRVSFDHKGKVQVFCAKSYSDVIKCKEVLNKYVEKCKELGIISTGS